MPTAIRPATGRQNFSKTRGRISSARALSIVSVGILAAFLSTVGPAPAQENGAPFLLPSVVVTANKQAEDLQNVPQSVTVLDGREVEDAHLTGVRDLGLRVPNLSFASGGMSMINLPSMRGVTSNPHSNIPAVMLYIDDVPVAVNAGYIAPLFDIATVEVLRGPQGTLYGRNSEGGVIKITTTKPGSEPTGKLTLEGGDRHYRRGNAALSGPLVDGVVSVGGAFQYYGMDGLVKNDFDGDYVDDKNNYSGRGTVRLTPTEDLEINLTFGMTKYDEGTFGMYNRASPSPKRHTDSQDPGDNRSSFNDQALSVVYAISPAWTFTSVGTRRESHLDYRMDYDFSPVPFFEVNKADQNLDLGQEFRLAYEKDGVSAVLGAAYNRLEQKIRYNYYNMGMRHYARSVTDSYAGFGQVKIPFADRWAVTAGARLECYTVDFADHDTGYSDSTAKVNFSPKLALEYAVTDTNSIYASLSKGFRAAGYDTFQGTPGNYAYDAEELWAAELGSKNTFWGGKARLNAAIFYHKFQNMQLESYVSSPIGPMPTITNVGSPKGFGGEVEVAVAPISGLEVFASAGYTHMRYDDFTDALGDHSGNRVPYVPELTYSAGLQLRLPSGFFARAEVLGADIAYLDSSNKGYIPAHTSLNAKIGWEFESFDMYLFGENITGERYDYVNAFGGTYGVATPGATFGGIVSYKF